VGDIERLQSTHGNRRPRRLEKVESVAYKELSMQNGAVAYSEFWRVGLAEISTLIATGGFQSSQADPNSLIEHVN
jgi:hypothetical protein